MPAIVTLIALIHACTLDKSVCTYTSLLHNYMGIVERFISVNPPIYALPVNQSKART